ncbi:hypothetical protein GQR58_016869 [Nymphon striatum]|nr:hypothetical protein GQR58_016869 [Nymphon striatum]
MVKCKAWRRVEQILWRENTRQNLTRAPYVPIVNIMVHCPALYTYPSVNKTRNDGIDEPGTDEDLLRTQGQRVSNSVSVRINRYVAFHSVSIANIQNMTPPASPYGHNFTTITGSPVYNISGYHRAPALHLWPYVTFAYNPYGPEHFNDTVPGYQNSPKHADVIEPKTPVLPHRQSQSYNYEVYDLSRTMSGKRPVGRVLFPSEVTEADRYVKDLSCDDMEPEDLTKPKISDDNLHEERPDRQLTNHSIKKLLGLSFRTF